MTWQLLNDSGLTHCVGFNMNDMTHGTVTPDYQSPNSDGMHETA